MTSGKLNIARFADPRYEARLDAAARLPSPERELALGRLDASVARRTRRGRRSPTSVSATSSPPPASAARPINPSFGIDLSSLCIR